MYKYIFLTALTLFLLTLGCTPLKRAQTGVARSVGGSEVITVGNHEVYCSQGRVCSEIDVLAIQKEERDGGRVRIVFKNRTGNTALIQVRLEVRNDSGLVEVETRPENISIPPTQEKSYEMRGISRKGGSVRVILSTAY